MATAAKKTVKPATKTAPKSKKVDPKALDAALAAAQGPIIAKAPAKTTAKPAETTSKSKPAVKKPDGQKSKMELATELYVKMKDKSRQDILAAFIDKAGLTKAGANTYLSLIKAKQA